MVVVIVKEEEEDVCRYVLRVLLVYVGGRAVPVKHGVGVAVSLAAGSSAQCRSQYFDAAGRRASGRHESQSCDDGSVAACSCATDTVTK